MTDCEPYLRTPQRYTSLEEFRAGIRAKREAKVQKRRDRERAKREKEERRRKREERYANRDLTPRWVTIRFPGECSECGEGLKYPDRAWYWPEREPKKRIQCETCREALKYEQEE